MKRLAAVMILGAVIFTPLIAQAVVLAVSVRDPKTVGSYEKLSAVQRESSLADIGDVISVQKDDWALDDSRFGNGECKNYPPRNGGTLVCVEFRGLAYKEALPLLSYATAITTGGETVIIKFRRFRINWESLPEIVRNEAFNTGMVSLDYADWSGIIIDKGGVK